MLPRQYPVCPRVFGLSLALLGPGLIPFTAQAQSSPALPASAPAASSETPAEAAPAQTAPGQTQTLPPAQTTQGLPSQPAATPNNASPQTAPSTLDAPLPAPAAQPAQPSYNYPLEAPLPSTAPAAPAPQPSNPLEQPIEVRPAEPPAAAPVQMTPPAPVASLPSFNVADLPVVEVLHKDHLGSTYIPVDSWVYPEALRLYSMGYLSSAFISMRPWTRRSLLHMLETSSTDITGSGDEQALSIYNRLMAYLSAEVPGPEGTVTSQMSRGAVYGLDTAYTRLMGIGGLTLRDSYHLGQTIVNDYGRPYERGFNNLTGFSSVNEWNRFSLYVRGEYQHAPSAAGYDEALSTLLSNNDEIGYIPPNVPQDTIPAGPIATQNSFRLQEAALSVHWWGHEFSGGKTDAWLGPAMGGAMGWSNNAENIYSFRINRVEPLHIPYVDKLLGPLRYDFFVGSLKGHVFPNSPWAHSEMFSFRPTNNFEFAFQRTVIWGGKGHEPVNLRTFFRSFFSTEDTESNPQDKNSPLDPGARFSDFSFSWRLPFLRRYVTLYTDSIAHDDVTPISAPRRAAYRPGVYLAQLPHLRQMDLRVEAASTDTSTLRSLNGSFNYFEGIQRNGYTNKGFIMGDWIGREAKGGQAWLTYHLSGNEWIQLEYLNKKTPKDFIPFGTTQNQVRLEVVKRLRPDVELDAWYQYEHWIAPIYQTSHQTDNVVSFQVTFYPKLKDFGAHLNGK